jgi:DNA-directed RNA polymerase subunit RPC12/RpoP
MHEYRYLAQERLEKATELLASHDDDDLAYACLELRKCIEALSYDLLGAYLTEVPMKAFEAWQPDKVMKELLRTDPEADHSSQIRIREEGRDGAPDGKWQFVGEDRRLKMDWATKSYHQLGSFLHVPTIRQNREGRSLDAKVARDRAEAIRAHLAHVLAATIWNANFSTSVTVNCSACKAPVKRRVSILESGQPIECGNCGQLYDATRQADGTYFLVPHSFSWECKACDEPRSILQSRAKEGADVSCPKCGDRTTLTLKKSWLLVREAEETNAAKNAAGGAG